MDAMELLARFVIETRYEDIPQDVLQLARRQVLDTIGVGLAGSVQASSDIIRRMVQKWEGRQDATVWAAQFKCPSPNAALANGTSCHALDFDDYWQTMSVHPSSVLIAAIMAAGETNQSSGRQFLAALIAGYEVAGKLGMAIKPGHQRRYHPTPVIGTMAAAAAVSNLMKLSETQLRMAMGIAASMAGGIDSQSGTMTKSLHAGLAARNGVMAAQLAAEGLTANSSVLDTRRGFFEAFFDGPFELGKAISSLGSPYHIISPGIGIKMYPSGWRLHHSFEAMLSLVTRYDIKPEQVKKIDVGVPHDRYFNLNKVHSGLEGKFSMQYHVAMAVLDRRLTIESFSDSRALAPDVQDFISRVVNQIDKSISPAEEKVFSWVTIWLNDGRSLTEKVETPRGHWLNQPTQQEVEAKFLGNARLALNEERIDRIKGIINSLDDLKNIQTLAQVLE